MIARRFALGSLVGSLTFLFTLCLCAARVDAAIAIAGSGANHFITTTGGTTTTIAVTFGAAMNMPTPTAHNVLVAEVLYRNQSTSGGVSATTPSGWVKEKELAFTSSASTFQIDIYYRIADATETSVTFTNPLSSPTGNGVAIQEYSGVSSTTPFQTDNTNTATSGTLEELAASLSSTATGNREIHFAANNGVTVSWTEDGSSTRIDANGTGTNGHNPTFVAGWGTSTLSNGGTVQSSETCNTSLFWGYYSGILTAGGFSNTKSLTATESTSATIVKATTYAETATASTSGALTRFDIYPLAATASTTPTFIRTTSRAFTATARPSGSLASQHGHYQSLIAAASSSTAFSKQTGRPWTATASTSGAAARAISRPLSASASASVAFTKSTSRGLAGRASTSGGFVGGHLSVRSFSATASTSGSLVRATSRGLAATATTADVTTRSINRALAASASTAATLGKTTNRGFAASARPSGLLLSGHVSMRSFTATVTTSDTFARLTARPFTAIASTTGSVAKTTGIPLVATVVSSSSMSKAVTYPLSATASTSGSTSHGLAKAFAATTQAIGNVISNFMHTISSFLGGQ